MRIVLLAALVLASCGGAAGPGAASPPPSVPAEVRNAPERVVAGGRTYSLEVELYRDVMPRPGPTPSTGTLSGMLRLRSTGTGTPSLAADRAWLLNGAAAWEAAVEPVPTFAPLPPGELFLSVRGGPSWDVGARIDAVLRYTIDGAPYLIRVTGAQIVGAA